MEENDTNDDIDQRILDAAKKLMVHYGYDKTTIADIASEAGVAKSTIYVRWKKKEALFDMLLFREGRDYAEDWFARMEADPLGGTFPHLYKHAVEALLDNDFMCAMFRRDTRLLGSMLQRKGVEHIYIQRQATLIHFFKALQQASVVRQDIDPLTLAFVMNSFQYGFIKMIEFIPEEQAPSYEQSIAIMVQMVEGYVTPEDGGDSEAGKIVLRAFMQQVRQQIDALEQLDEQKD